MGASRGTPPRGFEVRNTLMSDLPGQSGHALPVHHQPLRSNSSREPAFLLHALSYMRGLPSNLPIIPRSELVACWRRLSQKKVVI